MDYNELLLADSVLELASKIQLQKCKEFFRDQDRPDSSINEKRRAWFVEHPVEEFVPAALRQLRDVALIIRSQPA
jgi:hypothetical protein